MKQLQNNFTTPEQSKKLLELGVPANSADLVYDCALIGGEKYYSLSILEDELFSAYKHIWEDPCTDIIPCWSVGRLIELLVTCAIDKDHVRCIIEDIANYAAPVETYVNVITYLCKKKELDFSKLEE